MPTRTETLIKRNGEKIIRRIAKQAKVGSNGEVIEDGIYLKEVSGFPGNYIVENYNGNSLLEQPVRSISEAFNIVKRLEYEKKTSEQGQRVQHRALADDRGER